MPKGSLDAMLTKIISLWYQIGIYHIYCQSIQLAIHTSPYDSLPLFRLIREFCLFRCQHLVTILEEG